MTGKGIFLECRLHHPAQARKSSTQIGHSCRYPDPCSCWQRNHPSKHSRTVRNASTSTRPFTRSCALGSLISIDPIAAGEDSLPNRPDLLPGISVIATGRSLFVFPSLPSRYFLRQAKLGSRLLHSASLHVRPTHLPLKSLRRFGAFLQPISSASLLDCQSLPTSVRKCPRIPRGHLAMCPLPAASLITHTPSRRSRPDAYAAREEVRKASFLPVWLRLECPSGT